MAPLLELTPPSNTHKFQCLTQHTQHILKNYITDAFVEYYGIDRDTYTFPADFTEDKLIDLIRFIQCAMIGHITQDLMELSVIADNNLSDDIISYLQLFRPLLLLELMQHYEWTLTEINEQITCIEELWQYYCNVRLDKLLETLTQTELKQIIEEHIIDV